MIKESALAIPVPAAEPVVGTFRARHDPSAAVGVPAHITVLYPFMPPEKIDDQVEADLGALFLARSAFSFSLNKLKTFPEVLYLAPDPEAPFRDLIGRVVAEYPAYPPYGGVFQDHIPHLTIGHAEDDLALTQLQAEFTAYAAAMLPIRAMVSEVSLLEIAGQRWRIRAEFPLGKP